MRLRLGTGPPSVRKSPVALGSRAYISTCSTHLTRGPKAIGSQTRGALADASERSASRMFQERICLPALAERNAHTRLRLVRRWYLQAIQRTTTSQGLVEPNPIWVRSGHRRPRDRCLQSAKKGRLAIEKTAAAELGSPTSPTGVALRRHPCAPGQIASPGFPVHLQRSKTGTQQ